MNDFDFKLDIKDRLKSASKDLQVCDLVNEVTIQKIQTSDIEDWEYRDRRDSELGDITALSESIHINGQAQPIVVVERSDIFKSKSGLDVKYIVIAGYRRWLACKENGQPVDSIVKDMTFDQAISCLVSENQKESISDYSKGLFYADVMKRSPMKKVDFYKKIGLSKSAFNNYLSFSEIPKKIIDEIGDLSKVSARTAYEIKNYASKGDEYIDALVSISHHIRGGAGEKKLKKLLTSSLESVSISQGATKYSHNGVLAFSCNKNKITFGKEIFSSDRYNEILEKIRELSKEIIDSRANNE